MEVAAAGDRAFESVTDLRREHERLLDDFDRELEQRESADAEVEALGRLEPDIRAFIERGAAAGIYLAEIADRTAAQVLIDYWASSLARAAIGTPPSRLAPFDESKAPDLRDRPCPYVGLDAFRDPTFFFGREADTQSLVARIERYRLVVVIGASGSGKSSLVMGGALPALANREGSPLRIAPVIVPGQSVLLHLARAGLHVGGGDVADGPAAAVRLRDEPQYLTTLVGGEAAPPTVFTIDQFEEAFTLVDQRDREALALSLASFLSHDGHRVILTMREEFRSRLVELGVLNDILDADAWYPMRPMGYEELRAAVERPAEAVNLQFQSGIVDDVVKRVLGQPAALPLLQFTLRALWSGRDRNRVTWDVYRDVGDPLTALQTSADRFYESQPPETQTEVTRILLELVRVTELLEAYRQPLPKSQLLKAGRANTEAVLALLVREDYITVTDDGGTGNALVEVKHESLVRNWPRLVSWIEGKRIERRQRLALSEAAERWQKAGRPREGLLTGWQLDEAKRHEDLTEREREFVQASAAHITRAARMREWRLRGYAAGALALCVVAVISLLGSRSMVRLQNLSVDAASSEDPLTQAQLLVALSEGTDADGLERFARTFVDVASRAIPTVVIAPGSVRGEHDPEGGMIGVRFDADGKRVATVSGGGALRWWSAEGRGELAPPASVVAAGPGDRAGGEGAGHGVAHVTLSADGGWVAAVSADGMVHVSSSGSADAIGRRQIVAMPSKADSTDRPSAVALSPDGSRLALAFNRGKTYVWTRSPQGAFALDREVPGNVPVFAIGWDRSGSRLAIATADGQLRIESLSGNATVVLGPVDVPSAQSPFANCVDFSPDGSLVIGGYSDGLARVWSTAGSNVPLVLEGHTEQITAVAFGPSMDGPLTVATGSADRTGLLWTLTTAAGPEQQIGTTDLADRLHVLGAPVVLKGHGADVRALAFSGDGRHLATASADGTTRIWPVARGEPRLVARHSDEVSSVAFNEAGDRILSTSLDGTALVSTLGRSTVSPFPSPVPAASDPPTRVSAAAFSPDGSRVAVALEDGRLVEWDVSTTQLYEIAAVGSGRVLKLAYSRDGRRIAAASQDSVARVWDLPARDTRNGARGSSKGVARWTLQHPTVGGGNWVFDVAVDNDRALTASMDGFVRLWTDGKQTRPCGEIPIHVHAGASRFDDTRVLRVLFTDPDTIVAATANVISAWRRTRTAEPCWERQEWEIRHGREINDIAIGPRNVILSASSDRTVRLSDGRNGALMLALQVDSKVNAVAIAPRGDLVATGSADGAVRVWRVAPKAIAEYLAGASTACLSADDRRRYLSETDGQARLRYQACETSQDRKAIVTPPTVTTELRER